MEPLLIQGTIKTPAAKFDAEQGVIEIKGKSIPENSIEFFKPMVEWLKEYAKVPAALTTVNVQLEYFNTSSSKCILDVFNKLQDIFNAGNKVIINWYYEAGDEDMLEAGKDYESIIHIPFEMIEVVNWVS